jgi:organic hydroperoxide reductase OsmC/OhrA
MSEYLAKISWQRNGAVFSDNQYSRAHTWSFDGGVSVPASSSPQVVPVPLSDPANVDPEEAFVATVSSCHMLWFLSIAVKKRFIVDRYVDSAIGIMEKNEQGQLAITQITLCPQIVFAGNNLPTNTQVDTIHELAHDNCFIANSIKTTIQVKSTITHHSPQ